MNLLVYLTDGRTVYLLARRSRLGQLVGREPWKEAEGVSVVKGLWNPTTREYHWARAVVRFVRKASIAVVEEAPHGMADAVAPAAE